MADDDLAYGDYHGQGPPEGESERGFLGDTYRRFAGFAGRSSQPQDIQPVSGSLLILIVCAG